MLRPVIFLTLAILASAEKATFDNYQVFRIKPQTIHQLDLLTELELLSDSELNFWIGPTHVNRTVDLMVAPSKLKTFEEITTKYNLPYELYVKNVQTLIDQENLKVHTRNNAYTFDKYYNLNEMYQQLKVLEKQYSELVTVVKAGRTYEKREILGVRLSYGENKPVVVIEGGIHAREWISPATVMYLMHQLLTSQDAEIRAMAEAYEWYLFPSVNPDGYTFSHEHNRLWRKSRKPFGSCVGTDLNRNWDFKWMNGGASSYPCAETYAGPSPFSDIEAKTYSEFLTTLKDRMLAYIAFHSYSQLLLFPYGHTSEHLDNYDELLAIGYKTIETLSKRHGTRYVTGSIAETIYIAAGNSMDWVKGNYKVPITYTYELRDKGHHGFILPADQIIPNGEEVVDSLIAMFKEAKKYGYQKSS